jgi:hypothetical protein
MKVVLRLTMLALQSLPSPYIGLSCYVFRIQIQADTCRYALDT